MKNCFKCGKRKRLSEFYRCSAMADGHFGKCKECYRADVLKNRHEKAEYYRQYDRGRNILPHRVRARKRYDSTPAGKLAHAKAGLNYSRNHAAKVKATIAVNNAVRDGRLLKKPCEVCGKKKVEGHHADYSKPLEVRWLCVKHHKEEHRRKA